GDINVVIQAPVALRDKIARTVRTFEVDHLGCPATHDVTLHPERRPTANDAPLVGVTSVTACRYAVLYESDRASRPPIQPSLLSSARWGGKAASDLVRAIESAPRGTGPNDSSTCLDAYGDEMMTLRIVSETGVSQMYVRYSGCDHHGFDDGALVRALTRTSLRPFLEGPNRQSGWDSSMSPLIDHVD
ncbi:MAG: hypothetical protein JWP10_1699, partial [Nocardioidaceae bacterium]|nr:hypothetical protein [Nocardioidaceae bacterium]